MLLRRRGGVLSTPLLTQNMLGPHPRRGPSHSTPSILAHPHAWVLAASCGARASLRVLASSHARILVLAATPTRARLHGPMTAGSMQRVHAAGPCSGERARNPVPRPLWPAGARSRASPPAGPPAAHAVSEGEGATSADHLEGHDDHKEDEEDGGGGRHDGDGCDGGVWRRPRQTRWQWVRRRRTRS